MHTPSKDFVQLKAAAIEPSYQPRGSLNIPNHMKYDLHPPLHTKTDSQATFLSDLRPGSSSQGGSRSRPPSQRSNTLVKKDRTKKLSVEDILAMRRLEQGSAHGNREYPGIQPTKVTRLPSDEEATWPAYRSDDWSGRHV